MNMNILSMKFIPVIQNWLTKNSAKWKIGDTLDISDSLALADKFDPQIVGDALHLFFASKVHRSNESAEKL